MAECYGGNRSMQLMALDQALQTTGVAIFKDDKLIGHHTFSINPSLSIEKRLTLLWQNLDDLLSQWHFDYLAFEDIQNQHNNETYKKLAYCQAIILLWCDTHNMPYVILSPSHWRAVLGGGFGRARKEQKQKAQEYVQTYYGEEVNSDEADAICLGTAAIKEYLCTKKDSAF